MSISDAVAVVGARVAQGVVSAVHDDAVHVRVAGLDDGWTCVLLVTGEGPTLRLSPGDEVLVGLLDPAARRGVILGRIGSPTVHEEPAEETPDHLLLEAKKSLTLKCGDGSITIREDGKILIKGKNLVSLALETNRIKGGSVAIN